MKLNLEVWCFTLQTTFQQSTKPFNVKLLQPNQLLELKHLQKLQLFFMTVSRLPKYWPQTSIVTWAESFVSSTDITAAPWWLAHVQLTQFTWWKVSMTRKVRANHKSSKITPIIFSTATEHKATWRTVTWQKVRLKWPDKLMGLYEDSMSERSNPSL